MRSLYPWPIFPSNLEPVAARSLSLQLALQELVYSFAIIFSLQEKVAQGLGPQSLEAITQELEKILLFSLVSPFTKRAGTLDKLCFYSEELICSSQSLQQSKIGGILDQMRNAVLSFRAKILVSKRTPAVPLPVSEVGFLCDTLRAFLSEFYEGLFPFFEEARFDENVLFYLIEQKEQLNRFLSPKKVEDLLGCLYPSGPTHLRAILREGYSRRGFSEFYAKHEALIDSIEWTAGKCTQRENALLL